MGEGLRGFMTKYVQTRDELLDHLKDQIAFMKQSTNSYDNGWEDEAKRLAVAIRLLLHDTPKSTSLLTLLDKKNINFRDCILTARTGSKSTIVVAPIYIHTLYSHWYR